MSTCNRLELQTLGSQPVIISKNLPDHYMGPKQCSRLKSSMFFKHNLALQNIRLSKQPFKTQSQFEIKNVTWSLRCNLPATRIDKCRALSLQEVELDSLILNSPHCTGNMCHVIHAQVSYEFCISYLYSWIGVLDLILILILIRDDPKLPDDDGQIPKSQGRGWWFDFRL